MPPSGGGRRTDMDSARSIHPTNKEPDAIIVCSAFDRHNFGDLLFAHLASALLKNKNILFAGLAERDMRPYGGHAVRSVSHLAQQMQDAPVRILHAGGELLTCSAWEAAVMLLPGPAAHEVIMRSGGNTKVQERWAHAFLGLSDSAPYMVSRALFPRARAFVYNAVGGTDLPARAPALQKEVADKLAQAAVVGVRDRLTLASVYTKEINPVLMPDSAVMVADLFAATIDRRARQGEVARVRETFPHAYLAVQFSADFARHAFLEQLAAQLAHVAMAQRCAIVLFRAGAAPWHDDLDCYRQLAARLHQVPVHIFQSLNIWDICALIAHSRGYCGSSLHGRILALAFGLPRLNLRHPDQPLALPSKQEAFVRAWEDADMPGVAGLDELAEKLNAALAVDAKKLQKIAARLTTEYRKGFEILRRKLMDDGSDEIK